MALTEVQPQQRFFRITCDTLGCGHSVHVTAYNATLAVHRVGELYRWQADEQGQRCPAHSGEERRAA